MANVHGMDYSATVITTMQERAKAGNFQHLQYFQVPTPMYAVRHT
jgi:hypothetical protein